MTLYKGAGASSGQDRTVFTLLRERPLARWIGRFTRGGPYFVEQLTFTLSLLRHVTRQKPDVIFFSDCSVGNILWHWRNRTGQKYRLLFSNGGPLGPPFPRWDHVQQVAPVHFDAAVAAGQPPATMSMLPYGFDIPEQQSFPSAARRGQLRSALGLPTDRPCVLSIGAINASHKRMDYVVREVASMAEPRPTLVILGQRDHETHAIEQLAAQLLAPGTYRIATVEQSKVADYYDAADVFVLASLFEGYGRVLPEALRAAWPASLTTTTSPALFSVKRGCSPICANPALSARRSRPNSRLMRLTPIVSAGATSFASISAGRRLRKDTCGWCMPARAGLSTRIRRCASLPGVSRDAQRSAYWNEK